MLLVLPVRFPLKDLLSCTWGVYLAISALSHAQDGVPSSALQLPVVNALDESAAKELIGPGIDVAKQQDWLPEVSGERLPSVLSQGLEVAPVRQDLASPNVIYWLSKMIRANLPPVYEDARKWGHQKEVWDGVDFELDGLRVKTHSKRKLVNDGTWTQYRLATVEPENRMSIQFHRLEVGAGDGKVHFDVSVELLLDVFGRLSQWVRDVQLISLSANADAVCRFTVKGTVDFKLNPLQFPPDITIKPRVDQARIDVVYFRVRRISQLGGPLAKHLGHGLKRMLDEKLEESNAKLADKINLQLEKKAERMAFSTQDWLQSKLPIPTGNN